MFTSVGTLVELSRGNMAHKDKALSLAQSLPAYPATDEIRSIVAVYIKEMVMPRDPLGDALHLAFASFHKCDFLVTWNCEHPQMPTNAGTFVGGTGTRRLSHLPRFGHAARAGARASYVLPVMQERPF